MNLQNAEKHEEPWHRQGWPWFLISLPAIAVVASISTWWVANASWDGLVSDDYYKEGLAVVKVIDRLERAREIGLSSRAQIRDGAIRAELFAAPGVELPAELYLTIVHPTHSGFDQQVLLQRERDGAYVGEVAPLRAGRWRFQLENQLKDEPKNNNEARSWRVDGVANLPAETEIWLKPSDSDS
ncbi:MAG: FixH family protein [Azoarcus sp.]|jgi:hypothetical protein|nr:FixH family protein [Azoarcus sp.]